MSRSKKKIYIGILETLNRTIKSNRTLSQEKIRELKSAKRKIQEAIRLLKNPR